MKLRFWTCLAAVVMTMTVAFGVGPAAQPDAGQPVASPPPQWEWCIIPFYF